MEAKGKGGAALYNTVGTWTEEEKDKMSTYGGYNVGVAFALADYFHAKEEAFKAAKRDKEGRRGLLRMQRIEGEEA